VGRRFKTERPSPAALRKAVRAVLREPRYRAASAAMAAEMASSPELAEMTRVIDLHGSAEQPVHRVS
jgi:UDP:flavonoid glycosyltransferase YjiC (YdhE family)